MNNNNISKIMLSLFLIAICVACTESNEPDNYSKQNDNNNFLESGMYLGITSFNKDLSFFRGGENRYKPINQFQISDAQTYVSNLTTSNGTVLYYAVENNINYLLKSSFPSDLSNISIVTFTDGLDQGSSSYNDTYDSHEEYLNAIQDKLKTFSYNGVKIDAYAIGVKGSDVTNINQFKKNLNALSSSSTNAFEVANFDEVNSKFQEIASSLSKKSVCRTLVLSIPKPFKGTKERFIFDNVQDATNSNCYIEGIYMDNNLEQVTYVGLESTSGSTVKGEWDEQTRTIKFEFTNFTDLQGNAVATTYLKQYEQVSGTNAWQKNVEFDPSQATKTTEEKSSAFVMLIIDCSSSLGSDFANLQQAAKDFIATLADYKIDSSLQAPSLNYIRKEGNEIKMGISTIPGAIKYNIYRASSLYGFYNFVGYVENPYSYQEVIFTDNNALHGKNFYKITAVYRNGESDARGAYSIDF